MLVPVAIFIACLCVGAFASARWLPDLADGITGGLVFFVVCGLLGAVLGLVGLHIYSIVYSLSRTSGSFRSELVATGLSSMLWEAGSLAGIATAVYLLAPDAETADYLAGLEGAEAD
ncbi:MAG TPA: hypothetical protein VGP18_10685 [Solirubrobacteraceae bacterium]|jgi:hypothetical protein|nr:hypothetical protein [Solirubrobacteraceae bacterium]